MREKNHWKKTKQTQIEFGPIPKCILDTDPLAQVKQRRISTSPRIFIWVSMSQPQRTLTSEVFFNHYFVPKCWPCHGQSCSHQSRLSQIPEATRYLELNGSVLQWVFSMLPSGLLKCFNHQWRFFVCVFAIWGGRYPHCLQATPGHHFQHFHFSQKTRRWRIAEKSPITLISWSGKRAARPGGSRSKENGEEGQPCA